MIATLRGRYIYGDFCSGALWSFHPTPRAQAGDRRTETLRVPERTHIGTDTHGEPLLVSTAGAVYGISDGDPNARSPEAVARR